MLPVHSLFSDRLKEKLISFGLDRWSLDIMNYWLTNNRNRLSHFSRLTVFFEFTSIFISRSDT